MNCPSCGRESRADASFCDGCGAHLTRTCDNCKRELRRDAKFCDACGQAVGDAPRTPVPNHISEKAKASRAALEGERKQVTVLFCDVKGSMDIAEELDAEELARTMDRFFAILCDGVHRFEGTVDKFTGDGIMAIFGAPIAHEDHATRACFAALHLRDEIRAFADEVRLEKGYSFSARIGLNSGEVVVGKVGEGADMTYTAQGHMVGLAARMEALAEPGCIYCTQHTAELARGFFELRDLGPTKVKGVNEAVHVYEITGTGPLRTRFDLSRARGLSRLIGRTDELAVLEHALERAVAGEGQVVGVGGEAGVGKSRLCHEFVERCRARGIPIREAHGLPHGKSVPLLPVLELFREVFGITDQDTPRAARDKIAGRMVLLDATLTDAIPLVFDFLGVPDPERPLLIADPEVRQRQLFDVIRRMTMARSLREPAVYLFEDLHWIDGASEAFLANLVEAAPNSRTLAIVNFRPEYRAEWMGRTYYQQLSLRPLGSEDVRELLDELLGREPSVTELKGIVAERTAGNPFFCEEIVRSLAEAGDLEGSPGAYRLGAPLRRMSVPASVQTVLAARIDRLGDGDKEVLQAAAVVGKVFGERVLRRVIGLAPDDLERVLDDLSGGEFVYAQILYPEAEYAFKHPLTQEVAYGSLLTERRARLHAAVARAIVELDPDRLDERAALVAHHHEGAGDPLEAARWNVRAARWIGVRNLHEAVERWRRARRLLEEAPDSTEVRSLRKEACAGLLQTAWRIGLDPVEAEAVFEEGRQLAEEERDYATVGTLVSGYGALVGLAGDTESALRYVAEGARIAQASGDPSAIVSSFVGLAFFHYTAGQLERALAYTEEGIAATDDPGLGRDRFGYSPYVWFRMFRCTLLAITGRLGDALRGLDDALALARETGDLENEGWCHMQPIQGVWVTGELAGALEHARAGVEIAERLSSPFSLASAYWVLGIVQVLHGRWDEALAACKRGFEVAAESPSGRRQEPSLWRCVAEAHLGKGDLDAALDAARRAVETARRRGARFHECEALLTLGRVLLRSKSSDGDGEIESTLQGALDLARETGARSREPLVHLELAELARCRGVTAAPTRELREAQRLFGEMGCEKRAAEVEGLLVSGR